MAFLSVVVLTLSLLLKFASTTVLDTLSNTVNKGATLAGENIESLLPDAEVALAGSIINYSKWSLIEREWEIEYGDVDIPAETVHPGYEEAFVTEKDSAFFKLHHGVSGKLSWEVKTFNESYIIHFMYDIPYDLGFKEHNQLAIALCSSNDSLCRELSRSDLKSKTYSFSKRRLYRYTIEDVSVCNQDLCVFAKMGTGHKATAKIRVFPTREEDAATKIKEKLPHDSFGNQEYDNFLEDEKDSSNRTSRAAYLQLYSFFMIVVVNLAYIGLV
eukprot:TCONS_00002222-protein